MHQSQSEARQIEALLEFYLSAGIDCFVGDRPTDWFALTRAQAARRAQGNVPHPSTPPARSAAPDPAHIPAQASGQAPGQMSGPAMQPPRLGDAAPSAVLPDAQIIAAARDLAAGASSLDELRGFLDAFDGCNLKLTAKTLVFSDGNPKARVMFVGEAPGRDEDLQGRPFVGRSGQLLDRMLRAIELDRSSVYIANVVPWRPPGNRTPTPQETEICKPFITRQIELVDPDVLVFLGAASAKTLLGVQDGIRKMRGRWMKYSLGGREIAAVATYHPAYLLRSPLEKRLSWRDFLAIRQKLAANAPV